MSPARAPGSRRSTFVPALRMKAPHRSALALAAALLLGASPDSGAPVPATPPPSTTRPPARSATPAPAPALKNPVSITADKLQVLNKQSQAIYTGHVVAVRGTTRIRCGRLVATYSAAQEITRIDCAGGVEIDDRDRWARGERAIFETATGLLEVTGSPEARQGPNTMTGDRVLFDLAKDTIEVDRPRAVFELSEQTRRGGKSRGARDAGTGARTGTP